jgi:signal recognition particle subunit SEC65
MQHTLPVEKCTKRPLSKGAVSRRLTEDCVLRSKTYEVNKVLQTLFISYISPAAKYNPPPQFANWGTSFQKEAFCALL